MTMDPKQIAEQMIQFSKAAFDNTFNAMTFMHEQTEKMVGTYLEQVPMIPAEGKKALADWMKSTKKGREQFKAAVESNYTRVEDFFDAYGKGGKFTDDKPKAAAGKAKKAAKKPALKTKDTKNPGPKAKAPAISRKK
jgi:polyhydroxyalkanoate synthesis regulator phasin